MLDLRGAYDVIVVGGGPIGLSTAHECIKAKKKVLLLEKSAFFNVSGSSGDLVRMFRTAYTEDFMAKLAYQAMPLWDDLELEVGSQLRLMSGLLNFGDPNYGAGGPEGTLTGPIPNLEKFGLEYTRLTRDEIEAQNPFQNLPDNWEGIDMPDNGVINVPLLTRSLYKRLEELGADLLQYAEVKAIVPDPQKPDSWFVQGELTSDKGPGIAPRPFVFSTPKIAITSGAYVNHVLYPSFGFTLDLDIWELTSSYFSIDSNVVFPKMWFQFAEDKESHTGPPLPPGAISNLFYGFPSVPWGPPNMCRIAVDAATEIIKDPNERTYSKIEPADIENTRQFCVKHVLGVGPNPVPVFLMECLQTNVYDNMFVLDYIPDSLIPHAGPGRSQSIAVFTAGWAMKFVPLIGKVMKELLVDGGTTEYDISQFSMLRSSGDNHIVNRGPVKKAPHSSRSIASSLRC